jgi:hypothetical protein
MVYVFIVINMKIVMIIYVDVHNVIMDHYVNIKQHNLVIHLKLY